MEGLYGTEIAIDRSDISAPSAKAFGALLFDNAPVFRVCFSRRHRNGATRAWRPELKGVQSPIVCRAAFLLAERDGYVFHIPIGKSPFMGRTCGASKDALVPLSQSANPQVLPTILADGMQISIAFKGDFNVCDRHVLV